MAHGDLVKKTVGLLQRILIDAAVAVADGVWIDAEDFEVGSFHVKAPTTGTAQVRGSNEATKPPDNTHGFQIGADVTAGAETGITVEPVPRWIKGRVSAFTAGTCSIWVTLRGRSA